MPPRSLKTLETRPSVQGTVRTDVHPSIGTRQGHGFSVNFQSLYEVHGGFEPGQEDDASLLVIRACPMIKKYKQQFLHFKVRLSIESTDADENECYIESFEPAINGSCFYDVHTTNEEVQHMIQGTAQVTASSAATLGGQTSVTKTHQFTKSHLLKVTSFPGQEPQLDSTTKPNYVLWDICAANKEQGVGDSFTMALLVKRPAGSTFKLFAKVDGEVGSWSVVKKKLEFIMPRQTESIALAVFPLDRSNSPLPPGVEVSDLHRASTDNVMQRLEEIGIHLPELACPTKGDKEAVSATSLELNTAKENAQGSSTTVAPSPAHTKSTDAHSVDDIPAVSPPSATVVAQVATQQTGPADTATLTSIMRDLSLLMRRLTHEDERSLTPITASRITRHREMANAYERLAELHREEAKELQLWEDAGK